MNPNTPIKEIMTQPVVTVKPKTLFREIKLLFQHNNFHHLPVVDEDYKVLGIISKENWLSAVRNIARETTGETWTDFQYGKVLACDLMTPNPMVLDPDDSIGLAADIFLANRFHALPIVEDDRLQGILTSHDLLYHAYSSVIVQ
ncbi:MAG: CBS domain-containing protein [Bacteroidota bacterium]